MNIHKNARTTPFSRAEIVRRIMVLRETPRAVATALGVSERTVAKWLARYRAEGEAGLADRSSRPRRFPGATPANIIDEIIAQRRLRITGKQIARMLAVSPATVSRVLRKVRLSRMRDLDPPVPVHRYERAHPGELIHIDIKKLGRFESIGHRITGDRTRQSNTRGYRAGERYGAGWEFVHVCIDDASRIAFSQIHRDEKKQSAVAFLYAAIEYYRSLGVTVTRVMTDNGGCYRSYAFRDACKALGLKHIRTRPYTPKTNGKAERFIQTSLREWAYARAYPTSEHRKQALEPWLHNYNWHRPHGSLQSNPPISRLGQPVNNLLRLHI
ncbi:IS481 family transposase [Novosphingobium sp. Gsoil 351]|uniref:IS481 family transposase n=1 Tax=Novosphingobium sp. Gsoil 351 TaxID=2675225 RepID=UPI0012B45222|nr:IS481 family transposase [Novosphingobium sp. Gsoil 351]QGN54353.1 IS481 family transposase [Novosphingobium sp. Gsoil 351]QGN55758.1 IS481 family transposase [Novosphingobium sp. Gsoil 351]